MKSEVFSNKLVVKIKKNVENRAVENRAVEKLGKKPEKEPEEKVDKSKKVS